MKRRLIRSSAFVRAAKRVVKRSPQSAEAIRETLKLLTEDAHHPKLKSHKLKGPLAGSWACSVEYDLRIVFKFVAQEEESVLLLESIGTHEEVY